MVGKPPRVDVLVTEDGARQISDRSVTAVQSHFYRD